MARIRKKKNPVKCLHENINIYAEIMIIHVFECAYVQILRVSLWMEKMLRIVCFNGHSGL